jgi:broad specificity phosphatase PhoE
LEDIAVEHPDWYEELVLNPFHTRFPGGECYGDLTSRLESIVADIEQQVGPVLVVSHISILQVLVAYFRATPVEECTSIALPMNTVIKFTPSKGGGWQESRACAVISSSGSHCDLQSMDDTLHWEHKTPVGMSMEKRVMKKDCQPEDVGTWSVPSAPLIPNLPIWGDHCKSSSM